MKFNLKGRWRSLPNTLLTLVIISFVAWRLVPIYLANSSSEGKKAPDFAAQTITGVNYETQMI